MNDLPRHAGAGRLIYVVGPSGAGKDSVIASAKEKLNKIKYLHFSPRYVTRAGDGASEISLSANAFEHYKRIGSFALHWQAHGLHYGVSVIIDAQLRARRTVVVNGARANLEVALTRYPQITVVQITVPPAVARERLLARGREDAAAVAARLARTPAVHVPGKQLVIIDNSGPLERAAQAFARVLLGADCYGWARRVDLAHAS